MPGAEAAWSVDTQAEADKARELTLLKLEDHARFLEGTLARTNLADDAKGLMKMVGDGIAIDFAQTAFL